MKFAKFLRTPNLKNISERLLLKIKDDKHLHRSILLLQLADTYDNNNKPVDILVIDSEEIPGKTHYLLRRAVVRHDKETVKVRIVFDGSAKVDQCTSLNEALY